MNTNLWLIRREFWENRAIWILPVVFGAMLIVAALFGHVSVPTLATQNEIRNFGVEFLVAFGLMFYTVMSVYATWYLLDSLYADRKDRSILFWKSLPISDTDTVVSKLIVALFVIPVVSFLAADVTALLAAFIVSIRSRASIGGALWQPDLWLQMQVLWIYAVVTAAIWYLPVAGWLMLVSAWAKRAVILWSFLPPLVLYIIERWFLGTNVVGRVLGRRLTGLPMISLSPSGENSWHIDKTTDTLTLPSNVFHFINPSGFFSSPETWIGAAVGTLLIVGAIQLRMRRSEI
jgi:ABC-2 type transport system permease protein